MCKPPPCHVLEYLLDWQFLEICAIWDDVDYSRHKDNDFLQIVVNSTYKSADSVEDVIDTNFQRELRLVVWYTKYTGKVKAKGPGTRHQLQTK